MKQKWLKDENKDVKEWFKPVNLSKMSPKERRFYRFCLDIAKGLGFQNLSHIGLKHLILDMSMFLGHEDTTETETLLRNRFEAFEAEVKAEMDKVLNDFEKV